LAEPSEVKMIAMSANTDYDGYCVMQHSVNIGRVGLKVADLTLPGADDQAWLEGLLSDQRLPFTSFP
jgi:hypothetical protein